jgi:methylglutaconyl-CoA hydratase
MWRNGDWARRKGLFAELHPTLDSMEESIARLLNTLSHTSLAATIELKKSFWKNYDHWDTLLPERAAISARLALMPESKALIEKAKAKKTAP